MKRIQITEEYLKKYENDIELDDSPFDSDQEIEIRIPFEGYYSLTINCSDPQVAMAQVLKAHRDIGILGISEGTYEIEDEEVSETYCIIKENKGDE